MSSMEWATEGPSFDLTHTLEDSPMTTTSLPQQCPIPLRKSSILQPDPMLLYSWYCEVRSWVRKQGHSLYRDFIIDWVETVAPEGCRLSLVKSDLQRFSPKD